MYNGIGLQTPRGSGTNGYIQSNKFFIRPRPVKVQIKEFQDGQGTGGVTRKANKDILEHDRKRQMELKLVLLEEMLIEQGYTSAEIAQQLEETRKSLESAPQEEQDLTTSSSIPENTHQIAARKERQIEVLKGALGVGDVKEGDAFDRELQEKRKQERILAYEERQRAREEKEQEKLKKEKEERKQKKVEEKELRKVEEKELRRFSAEAEKRKAEDAKAERHRKDEEKTEEPKSKRHRKDEERQHDEQHEEEYRRVERKGSDRNDGIRSERERREDRGDYARKAEEAKSKMQRKDEERGHDEQREEEYHRLERKGLDRRDVRGTHSEKESREDRGYYDRKHTGREERDTKYKGKEYRKEIRESVRERRSDLERDGGGDKRKRVYSDSSDEDDYVHRRRAERSRHHSELEGPLKDRNPRTERHGHDSGRGRA